MENINGIKAGDLKINNNSQKIDWEAPEFDLSIEAECYAIQAFKKQAAKILEQAGKEPSDMQKENSERAFRRAFREALRGAEEEAPVVEIIDRVLSTWEAWFKPYDFAPINMEISLTNLVDDNEEDALRWVLDQWLHLPNELINAMDTEASLQKLREMAVEEWQYWHGTPREQIKITVRVTARENDSRVPKTQAELDLQNSVASRLELMDWYVPKKGIDNEKEVTDWVRETQQ